MRERLERLTHTQRTQLADKLAGLATSESGRHDRLTAWIVSDEPQDSQTIRRQLARHLPQGIIPQLIHFVDKLPKTPSGKTDRRRLPSLQVRQRDSSHADTSSDDEQKLLTACTEVLGHSRFSLDDTFFDAGGDSLRAISLIATLRDRGVDLVATDITQQRTIRDLALLASTRTEFDFRTEVLHRGREPGLVVFAAAYGETPFYRDRFEGVCDPRFSQVSVVSGTLANDRQFQSVEEIASLQADYIVEFEPNGPFVVVGFCWGGVIAFELARRLEKKTGRRVPVVLIEAKIDPTWTLTDRLELAARYLMGVPLRIRAKLRGRRPREILAAIARRIRRPVPPTTKPKTWNPRKRCYIRLLEQYRPRKWDGEVILLRSEKQAPVVRNVFADHTYGWQKMLTEGPKVILLDGHHLSCLAHALPHLNRIIAEKLT